MKRAEIEARLITLQEMWAKETDSSTLATLNRCIENLIMMDAEDDDEPTMVSDPNQKIYQFAKGIEDINGI